MCPQRSATRPGWCRLALWTRYKVAVTCVLGRSITPSLLQPLRSRSAPQAFMNSASQAIFVEQRASGLLSNTSPVLLIIKVGEA
jgi:hypothetical protein